jgi:hypothetical protein
MSKTTRSKIKTVTFNSVGDFVAAACKDNNPQKSSHSLRDANFSGTETFDEAIDLSKNGWPEGVERLSRLRASLDKIVEKTLAVRSKALRWDLTGDFLDVGRHLSGEPESFGEYRDESESHCQTRVIKLVANVSAIGSVSTESIFSAGAAIFAAVDILESLGHRVELWLGSGSSHNSTDKRLQVFVLIKQASQPFDADRLAFFLCSNASLRRLFFSVEEDLGFNPNNTRTTPLVLEDDAIVTPEVERHDSTQDRRIERVLQVCESVGITFTQQELETITS